jgi:hypothetical protein
VAEIGKQTPNRIETRWAQKYFNSKIILHPSGGGIAFGPGTLVTPYPGLGSSYELRGMALRFVLLVEINQPIGGTVSVRMRYADPETRTAITGNPPDASFWASPTAGVAGTGALVLQRFSGSLPTLFDEHVPMFWLMEFVVAVSLAQFFNARLWFSSSHDG